MDCNKDFRGEAYDAHTRCISEEQKYSGKDYVPKENANAGQKKQDTWMESIRAILESKEYKLSSSVRGAFQKLQNYDNVPRKQAKFQNFIRNCLRMDPKDAEKVWKILEAELDKFKQANVKANEAKKENGKKDDDEVKEANGNVEEQETVKEKKKSKKSKAVVEEAEPEVEQKVVEKKKSKKRPAEDEAADTENKKVKEEETESKEEAEEVVEGNPFDNGLKFDWSGVILTLVNKKEEIALEKLKKKVVKKYLSHSNIEVSSEKQERKINKTFTKFLKKCKQLNVTDEVVKLVQ